MARWVKHLDNGLTFTPVSCMGVIFILFSTNILYVEIKFAPQVHKTCTFKEWVTLNIENNIDYFYGFWVMLPHLSTNNIICTQPCQTKRYSSMYWCSLELARVSLELRPFYFRFPSHFGCIQRDYCSLPDSHHQYLASNARVLKHGRGTTYVWANLTSLSKYTQLLDSFTC